MDLLKKAVEITLSPLGITTLFIALGLILTLAGKYQRTGRRLLFSGGLLFLILLFAPASEYLILQLERDYPPMMHPPSSPGLDRIVILAGYAEEHPAFPITTMVSEPTICTTMEGLRLYRLLPGSKLVLSGGVARDGEQPVAAAMADLLHQMGVAAKDTIVEGNSKTTYENLVEVKKIIGSAPFMLVAQACDLRRAMAVARKLEMNPVAAPACFWALQHHLGKNAAEELGEFLRSFLYPSTDNLYRIQWAYHEYVGYAWYRLLGRI